MISRTSRRRRKTRREVQADREREARLAVCWLLPLALALAVHTLW